MANEKDGVPMSPFSRLCALLGLMVWTLNAFGTTVQTEVTILVFKNFDTKMPAPTLWILDSHWLIGGVCLLVVVAILTKECLQSKWKKFVDWPLLALGLLVCLFVQGALWLPFVTYPNHSLMGGGQ